LKKDKLVYKLWSALPILLCVALCFLYDSKNTDSALGVLLFGSIFILFTCPVYLAILSYYFSKKKKLHFDDCKHTSFFMNALANLVFYIILLILIISIAGRFDLTMALVWLPLMAVSQAVMAICLLICKRIRQFSDKRSLSSHNGSPQFRK